MNKNIKLAVAGAVLALSASAANAGIIIPAGDWTIDINGNVNGYANWTSVDHDSNWDAGIATGSAIAVGRDDNTHRNAKSIQTGLLPAWIGFTGKTRQNDLDVEFTISLQPGISEDSMTGDGALNGLGLSRASSRATVLNRQTYLSFGDKSWGSVKIGKDLGIYASDAILNDMTLLGVGAGAGLSSTLNSTAGGIGTGYQYAAWKGQIAYTTPNFSGFQATVGIVNPNMLFDTHQPSGAEANPDDITTAYQPRFGFEGKASYSFATDAISGKVWTSGATYKVRTLADNEVNVNAYDLGVNLNVANFGLTGYVYDGRGNGITFLGLQGINGTDRRDGDGGYVQATYALPTKTKVGLAYGESKLSSNGNTAGITAKQDRTTVGVYHPLTKHLNLVAEYSDIKIQGQVEGARNEYTTGSLGAILFF